MYVPSPMAVNKHYLSNCLCARNSCKCWRYSNGKTGLCPGGGSVYLDKTDDKHISQEVNNYRN